MAFQRVYETTGRTTYFDADGLTETIYDMTQWLGGQSQPFKAWIVKYDPTGPDESATYIVEGEPSLHFAIEAQAFVTRAIGDVVQ